jgi:hypothetical protein
MSLALLALLAQFWMVQIGTSHLSHMLTQAGAGSDICTVQGAVALASTGTSADSHTAVDAALHCPYCAAAAASAVAVRSDSRLATMAPRSGTQFSFLPAAPRALRHASLYPPAHAPPQA